MNCLRLPSIAIQQSRDRIVYTLAVDGKLLPRFTTVSRVSRDVDSAQIAGYQRPEVLAHIRAIRSYLESEQPMMPNGIVVAFDSRVSFDIHTVHNDWLSSGEITIPLDEEDRPGWIVDGQQRTAAVRDADISSFPIFVNAFIAKDVAEQRAQFILVNATKPLPKGLIHELLPSTDAPLPAALHKKKLPALLLSHLNHDTNSPLRGRIRTPTTPEGAIKDNSVLKMLENSISDGALYYHRDRDTQTSDVEAMLQQLTAYWQAVAETFPDDWERPPRQSRLTHGLGIVSLGFLMDAIADQTLADPPSKELYSAHLALVAPHCAWSHGTWDFTGHKRNWNELQNTPTDIQLVSDHLLTVYRRALAAPQQGVA